MKIEGIPGVYYAQALLLTDGGWKLCGCFHGQRCDAEEIHEQPVQWPVEIEDGIAYVPSEEELKDAL